MPTAYTRIPVVKGKTLRVTALDECGDLYALADAPTCEAVVSGGVVSLAVTHEYETGTDIRDKNWNDEICVEERTADQLIRVMVTATFCQVDPVMASIIAGLPTELDVGGQIVGFRQKTGLLESSFALEAWTGSPAACGVSDRPYGYMLFPWVTGGRVGDITIQNGRADFVLQNAYTRGDGGWASGPYDVVVTNETGPVLGPLPVAMGGDEPYLFRETRVAPPSDAASCLTLEEAGGTRPV
jgi:hypothetical protein